MPAPSKSSALRAAIVAGLLFAGLAGCGGRQPSDKAESSSIIARFNDTPTPQQAAAWAVDPFSADKRFRGLLLLANAPWGGERVYMDLYVAAIKDGDPSVRTAAIRALALHGGPEHVPLVVEQLDDSDRLLRWESARALQRLHNPAAVAPLLERLDIKKESEPEIRAAAAVALGQYPEARVVDALITAVDDRDLAVNHAALQSLRVLTGQDHGFDMRAWVGWAKDNKADLFAGRGAFEYPVFSRNNLWWEWVWPFGRSPNEVASVPAGMDAPPAPQPPSE